MDTASKKSKIENQFKNDAICLVDALEKVVYKSLKEGNTDSKTMRRLLEAKDFLRDRGSMVKMILESIALTLPILK